MLSRDQESRYHESGFLILKDLLEVDELRRELAELVTSPSPQRTLEKDQKTVRSYHGAHLQSASVRRLARDPRLLIPARQLVGGDVYLYQTRLILKEPFHGDAWPWHQDFLYWYYEDGIRRPDLVLAVVYLEDVTHLNGPLVVVEGSHQEGMIDLRSRTGATERGDWKANLGKDIEFVLEGERLEALAEGREFVQALAPRGSVLFFHPNLVHASGANISPYGRPLLFIVYNRVDNVPVEPEEARPDFLCSSDYTPLEPLSGSDLGPG